MKRSKIIAFIIPVLILSSCENLLFSEGKIAEGITNGKQLIFFSDDENIKREAVYYDALLDIRKEFPEAFADMKVISEKTNYKKFNVDIYPSLLVIDKEEVVVHIEGIVSKEEILDPVTHALSNK